MGCPHPLLLDVGVSLRFCTRLPVPRAQAIEGGELSRASWALPLAGAVVALIAAAAFWLASMAGLPRSAAAILAVATTLFVTGALHEDGLADTVDGFGGGTSSTRKLEIMRDSRIGTFGTCALATSLALRWSALASLAEPLAVTAALIAAHASARAVLPAFMRAVPCARKDGLSAAAGAPPWPAIAVAAGLGLMALVTGLGLGGAMIALLLLVSVCALIGVLALRQIGGQTGDVLGALEQTCEALVLLTAAALHRGMG